MPNEIPRMEVARKAMEECARFLISDVQSKPENEWKGGNHSDLVTAYDREVERRLVEAISAAFPEDLFLTEEEDRGTGLEKGIVWVIDPIDGTTNFVHFRRDYSISVGCYREGKPWFGLVLDPVRGELFEGISGGGARLNGHELPRLDKSVSLHESLVDFSMNTTHILRRDFKADLSDLAPLICGHRAYGSASLILCRIARGECHIYLSAKLSLWDYAAAGIILREVGGDYLEGRRQTPKKGFRSGRLFLAWGADKAGKEIEKYLKERNVPLED
ncbi:MAG: inositol monophosphatase [Spirochaetales bacterium]|nr:inositol monophosphatase [Spirochaetales bacterium]